MTTATQTHTPGPWSLNTITEYNGELRDGWYGVWGRRVDDSAHHEVCRVHVDDPSSTNARDDAKLIASAPALLAALEANIDYLVSHAEVCADIACPQVVAYEMARDAIEQATAR